MNVRIISEARIWQTSNYEFTKVYHPKYIARACLYVTTDAVAVAESEV